MKRLFTVNLTPDKKRVVDDICSRLGAVCAEIDRRCYGVCLGDLCAVDDPGKCSQAEYTGRELSMDMLIFYGVSSKELDIFLDRYRASGLEPVKLKAMVTETNSGWTVEQLYGELAKEYLFYKMRGK